ncbi:MAG: hypothetical protein EGS06_01735, partial [Megamonas funiformis]|nr:hypothetical protein [Megamonas funiformis]
PEDKWVLSKYNKLVAEVTENLENFDIYNYIRLDKFFHVVLVKKLSSTCASNCK